ncbi:MAG: hypothetical protein CBC31_000395 [Verrucomicrobia bacterium TMED71]|nr:MAG: hypothetical protein CBC31_000395 [Verrucomicrobia bacterium TMED71]
MKLDSLKYCLSLYLCLAVGAFSLFTVSAADLVIDIGTPSGAQSGPLLVGANVVYSHEDISSWQDGEKIQNHEFNMKAFFTSRSFDFQNR